ncbi:DNA polymerase eta [Euphorbia peplus]|nr:DNA polymerase eta [Euphorbia peplus]
MPVARPESSDARIIAHVDMDCFYVQVEQRKQPHLKGLPTAVVQYNDWKGGGLIAVSYEARKFGVKRSMRGDEAKKVCPLIQLVQVPVARGKADLTTYRNAGSEVVSILSRKGRCERASIDEVYLDLTDAAEAMLKESPPESLEEIDEEALKSHVLGLKKEGQKDDQESVKEWLCSSNADHRDKLLACAVLIIAELRKQVLKETEFTCSAGIAHNKMLAKLASGMNKPSQQTVVPFSSVKELLDSLPIKKMKQLGGKLGSSLQIDLGVNTVGDLLQFSEEKLQDRYGINTGTWLWNIARGINGEEVQGRLLPKSHGSGKTFPGPRALRCMDSVQHWINQLCEELSDRLSTDLDQNKRIAHTLTLNATAYKSTDTESHKKFPSKSCPLRYGTAKIQEDSLNLFQAGLREYMDSYGVKLHRSQQNIWGITSLSVSASKIVDIPSGTSSIMKYFHGQDPSLSSLKQMPDILTEEAAPLSTSGCESYSDMKLNEPQLNYNVLSLDQPEREVTAWQDQDSSGFSSKKATDGFDTATSLLLPSGSKSHSGLNQSNSHGLLSRGDNQGIVPNLKEQKQKGGAMKDKGTSSIMNYFHGQDPSVSSLKRMPDILIEEAAPLSTSGCESYSNMKLDEQQIDYNVLSLDQPEENITQRQDQDSSGSSSKKVTNGFKTETSLLLPSEGKSYLGLSQRNSHGPSSRGDNQGIVPKLKELKQKRGAMKDKGTILKLFNSYSSSFSSTKQDVRVGGSEANETVVSQHRRNDEERESWNYKSDEIDPCVVDELPREIQEEIRAWLRPTKRSNVGKRGCTISHYFPPSQG